MNANKDFDGEHADLTRCVIGTFYAVANELGYGFMESVYRRSMLIALQENGLKAEQEVEVPVHFHGRSVGNFYADLVVEDRLILELKIADQITRQHEGQLLHYLRSSRVEIGFVLAFGEKASFKRLVMRNDRKPSLRSHTGNCS